MSNFNNPNSHNDNDWSSSNNNNTHPGQGHGNASLPSSYSSLGQSPAPPHASLGVRGTDGYSYVSYPGHQSTTTNAYAASQSTTANNTNNMTHPSTHHANNQGGFTYASLGTASGHGHGVVHNTNQFSYSSLAGNSQPQTINSKWGPPPQQYPQQYYQQQHTTQYQNQQQQQYSQTYSQQYTSMNYPPLHAQHRVDSSLPLPPPPPPPKEQPSNINKLKRTNLDNGQQQGTKEAAQPATNNNSVSSKKPPQPPPPQKDQTDDAVNAIGALSNLQHRWSAPTAKRKRKEGASEEIPNPSLGLGYNQSNTTKRQRKRQRRRNKKKKKVGTSIDNPIIIRDDDDNEWIDVDHSTSSEKKQQPQQEVNFTVCNFPPLESNAKSEEATAVESSMKDMSTSQLKSYASVLGRALAIDDNGNANKEQAPTNKENEVIELLDDTDTEKDDEMDISDDDDSQQQQEDHTNPTQKQEINNQEQLSLKLAELKAKAKLARAKLRIAEQKKAKGTRESLDPSARSDNTTSGNTKTPPPLSPHTSSSTSPLPPMLANITALRNIVGSLVIENVALTGPSHEVRFVNSVYSHIRDDDDDDTNNQGSTTSNETQKKKSLNHKLQLMKLQLEIKKKELEKKELEKRRRAMLASDDSNENTIELKPPPEQDESETGYQSPSNEEEKGENTPTKQDTSDETLIDTISDEQKLEQLRNRQKELKQKNDIANLRNLIHRQRDLLQAQGKELTESSTQLQQCVDGIKTKQELLEVSNKKLIDMNNRKRRLESMVLQATEQVVAARKALSERRQLGS